jgi:hypothetical protein
MAEPLFGTNPQLWSAIPNPGFAYFQTFPGTRVLAGSPQVMNSPPTPFASPAISGGPLMANPSPADVGQAMAAGWPAVATTPIGGGLPVLTALDFANGVTPQALLATVAMRRGQPMGPTNDQEIEEFICDALDLLPGATDVEVRCDGGRATLTGSVPHKRLKRDVGELVWAIPSVNDVQNNITIVTRRRSRPSGRDAETPAMAGGGRKQA